MAASAESMEQEDRLQGVGCKRRRKEDARFIQGKGNYVDDIKLPGMLFADFVRSPHAHARIKSINKDRALALPGVHAVLTADDLKPLKLHWMPMLAGDVQAVLADEKVCFQPGQAHAPQSHLHLAGGRQGWHGSGLPGRRGHGQAGDGQSPGPPPAPWRPEAASPPSTRYAAS
jgi:hypothetical protein